MTTEGVKFLIDAEDQATEKIRKATAAAEENVKQVKDVGGKAKASTELVGTLAVTMGGSGVGGFAGELAQLTERVSAFSEVAKEGGTGALAFKAGLYAATAAISIKVGLVIGNWISDFRNLREELEETFKSLDKNSEKALTSMGRTFDREREQIGLIIDPDEQEKAILEFADKAERNLQGATTSVEAFQKKLKNDDTFVKRRFFQADIDLTKKNLEQAEALLAQRKAEAKVADDLRESVGAYAKDLERTRKSQERAARLKKGEAEATAKALDDELKAKEKLAKTEEDRIKKLAKEKESRLKNEQAEAKKLADTQNSVVDSLKLQVIALRDGEEAARMKQLMMQGLDESTANQLANLETQVKKEQELVNAKKKSASKTSLSASDQRLLTGQGDSDNNKLLSETAKQTKVAEANGDLLDQMLAELITLNTKPQNELAVVGD